MSTSLPLKTCANGCGCPPAPPSLVICKACQERITQKLEAMAERWGAPPSAPAMRRGEGKGDDRG